MSKLRRRWCYDVISVSLVLQSRTISTERFRWRWMARMSQFLMSIAPQYGYPFIIPTEVYEAYL